MCFQNKKHIWLFKKIKHIFNKFFFFFDKYGSILSLKKKKKKEPQTNKLFGRSMVIYGCHLPAISKCSMMLSE